MHSHVFSIVYMYALDIPLICSSRIPNQKTSANKEAGIPNITTRMPTHCSVIVSLLAFQKGSDALDDVILAPVGGQMVSFAEVLERRKSQLLQVSCFCQRLRSDQPLAFTHPR